MRSYISCCVLPGDGSVKFRLHGIQQEPQLQRQFHGYSFFDADKKNLQETGNMGTVAQITAPKTKEQIPVFISRDRQTNELEYMRADKINLPNEICGAKLTDKHKEELYRPHNRAMYFIPNGIIPFGIKST